MPFSPSFGGPFFEGGTSTALNVPGTLPVAIGGHAYLIDYAQYTRETVDALRSAYDSLAQPGEQSLNTIGIWRRWQNHWEFGCGQGHFDEKDLSNPFRFNTSKGIDPWTEDGTIRLLPVTEAKASSSGSGERAYRIGNAYLYLLHHGATTAKFTTDPSVNSPSWTSVTGTSGNITGFTTDGDKAYISTSAGVYSAAAGVAAMSAFGTYIADFVQFANGHMIAGKDNELVELDSAGADTTLVTHFNASFNFVCATGAPSGIFVGGNSSDRGEFFYVGFNSSTGALAVPIPAGALPRGEFIRTMSFYEGRLLLATSKGFREAEIVQDRGVSIGAVVDDPGNVQCLDVDGEFAWFGWSQFDATSSGIGRARLSRETEPLVPAYCSDLMATSVADVLSVVSFAGRRYFTLSGGGLYGEDDSGTLVASGTIDSGLVHWGTPMEKKIISSASLSHDPLAGEITLTIITEDDSQYNCGTSDLAGSTQPSSEFSGGNTTGELFEVRLTLTRDAVTTTGPVVRRWTVRAQVVPVLTDSIVVPIIMKTRVKSLQGDGFPVPYDPLNEFLFLKSLEAARVPVVYQEGELSQNVVVDKVQVKPERMSVPGHRWFEGIVYVRLLSVQSVVGD